MDPILLFLVLIAVLLVLIISIRYYNRAQSEFLTKIANIQAPYKTALVQPIQASNFEAEMITSVDYAELAQQVEEKIYTLPFPILEPLSTADSGTSIFERLGKAFDTEAPVFAGVEQVVLTVLPPDQVANCVMFAVNSLGVHATATMQEIAPILKQSAVEGWTNLHNFSVVKQSLADLFVSLKDNFGPAQIAPMSTEFSGSSVVSYSGPAFLYQPLSLSGWLLT